MLRNLGNSTFKYLIKKAFHNREKGWLLIPPPFPPRKIDGNRTSTGNFFRNGSASHWKTKKQTQLSFTPTAVKILFRPWTMGHWN